MKIVDSLKIAFSRRTRILSRSTGYTVGDLTISAMPFGRTVFLSMVELLTDLTNDVTFRLTAGERERFLYFNAFFKQKGEYILNKIYTDGFVVIGASKFGFRLLNTNESTTVSTGSETIIKSLDPELEVYVMKSQTYESFGVSDLCLCAPYVTYLDNILNASSTASERLGLLAIMTPKATNSMPVPAVLTEDQKKELEQDLQREYGALRKQNSLLILPREMNVQTLSLASMDLKVTEKVKIAILAIAGKIKIPANQVPLIDAMSSKSLSNGGELREGDFNKYQTFERLLNKTFIRFAEELRLQVDYSIYNKPLRQQ